jgi:hypothetical protein
MYGTWSTGLNGLAGCADEWQGSGEGENEAPGVNSWQLAIFIISSGSRDFTEASPTPRFSFRIHPAECYLSRALLVI